MELNLQRQPITINEVVYDGSAEQPLECDALLPDYCPDIVKILKCGVEAHISSATAAGERCLVEGMALAHVYYVAERGLLRHAEYKIPFSKSVELRGTPNDPVVTVTPSVDYINCRAVNQRRIDIRGAVTLKIKVVDQKQEQVVSDATGGGMQLRRDVMHVTELAGHHESSFPVAEELEIGYGKSPVGSIVRADAKVNVSDHKIIAGKVVVKADFLLHVCYQPTDQEKPLEIMEYSLPLSQIVDAEGTDESCLCEVDMFVNHCDVSPKQADDGEYRMLALDAGVKAVIGSHRHNEIPVASDCYSTKYDCSCKHKKLHFMRLQQVLHENVMHKASLDLPKGTRAVLDAWCEVDNLSWKVEEKELKLAMRLMVSMFAVMEDGETQYFEQSDDVEKSVPLKDPPVHIHLDPSAGILSCAYSIVGDKIDIRCEVLVKGCVYYPVSVNAIAEVAVDENKPKPKEYNKIYIYYADEGESIWNIAKQYNTSAGAIWEENNATDDVLPQKSMLLIPIV